MAKKDDDDDDVRSTRSPDFRILSADSFGLRFNENTVTLRLALEFAEKGSPERFLEVGVISMTPRSLKVLNQTLSTAIAAYEERLGVISVPKRDPVKVKIHEAKKPAEEDAK